MYVCIHICIHAPECAKMHSCLSLLHSEVAGRSRQSIALTKPASVSQLRRAVLTKAAAWLEGSEKCGKIVCALALKDLHG